ncbi:MAG TPA: 2-C-methyl-D-erythritol 4-phosphate cytidylyltransferase [Burkholderiaceae bacterium]|nr:2-C-methyl-D-erythritol 4-phosphate cytidylyltransferase [Burkholderiaceae bacterium]
MNPRRHFAIVPAAGVGSRFGAPMPKQYLPIGERTVLQWAVAPLLRARWIEQVLVAVAPNDDRAAGLFAGEPRVRVLPVGGATRRDTVLNALAHLHDARDDDWVLVHDAARPGLDDEALQRLRDELSGEPSADRLPGPSSDPTGGGLLAWPVSDTVKRAGDGDRVAATLPRDGLWLAQTPQMFGRAVLQAALARHPQVTDEAGAVEAEGRPVRLVRGSLTNFKVTTSDDLALMRRLLLAGEKR